MRYHYMDVARAVLMTLGVVLHAAAIFSTNTWLINDQQRSVLLTWLEAGIHAFRMPSFFFIAGFFTAMMIVRYPLGTFLRRRLVRLGIPTLFCGLVLNQIMEYVGGVSATPTPQPWADYWLGGDWLYHLWFMKNLIGYILLFCLGYAWLQRYKFSTSLGRWMTNYYSWLCCLPVACFLLVRVGFRIPEQILGVRVLLLSETDFLYYVPFFLFGVAAFFEKRLLEQCLGAVRLNLVLVLVCSLGIWLSGSWKYHAYLAEILNLFRALPLTGLVLWLFRACFDRPNAAFRAVSDASYSIYLLHQPIIVLLGRLLLPVAISIYLKFVILAVVTFYICLFLHQNLVERSRIAGLLVNGRDYPAARLLLNRT